jgi:hypothetical protein
MMILIIIIIIIIIIINNYRKAENVTFAYGDRSSLHDAQLRRVFRL